MSENAVRIYYHGRKAVKRDNIIRDSGRVWEGYGSYQDVWAAEAAKYLQHPDVWTDKKPSGKKAAAPSEPRAGNEGAGEGASAGAGEGGRQEPDDRMQAIIEGIQRLDPKKDYTAAGKPKVTAVVEAVGTNVSADEIAEAMNYINDQG